VKVRGLKVRQALEDITLPRTTLLHLGSLWRNFGINIDNLEACLEEVGMTLASIVILLLLYEKMINGGWITYFGLESNCKSTNLVMWSIERSFFLKLSSLLLSCTCVKFGVATSLENLGERLRKSRSFSKRINSKLKAIHPTLFSF